MEFYIVYVGAKEEANLPDFIDLTEEFFSGNACEINIRAKIIRAPMGRDILSQYMEFCRVSNRLTKERGRSRTTAETIISECIGNGILTSFLEKRREEVMAAMVELFSQREASEMMLNALKGEQERALQKCRQEGRQQGRMEGRMEGKINTLLDLVHDGLISPKDAAAKAGLTEENLKAKLRTAYPN